MMVTLSNIAVRLVVDHTWVMSALNQSHIVQRGIGSNVDYHHHLATLTVQTPQMSFSCPLTFDVVDGLHCNVILGADWFDRTAVNISDCFPLYDCYALNQNDHTSPVHVDIHNDGFGGAASAPDVRAPDNKILDVYSMTK